MMMFLAIIVGLTGLVSIVMQWRTPPNRARELQRWNRGRVLCSIHPRVILRENDACSECERTSQR